MRINMLVYLKAGETCGIGIMLIRDPRQYAVANSSLLINMAAMLRSR